MGRIVWFGNSTLCYSLVCARHMKYLSCMRLRKCDGFLKVIDMETKERTNICNTQIIKDK